VINLPVQGLVVSLQGKASLLLSPSWFFGLVSINMIGLRLVREHKRYQVLELYFWCGFVSISSSMFLGPTMIEAKQSWKGIT